MITAEVERDRVTEAISCGVSDLLVKPYTAESLGTHIEKAMRSRPRPTLAGKSAHARSAARNAEAGDTKDQAARPPTILVVDDTPDNLHLLSHLFKDDYSVRIANNGAKALEICCSDDPPDLVLLDIMMPDMDGFEVARRMREHPNAETIPVIFVTAMDGEDARLKGLELGAVDFVTKPIDPGVLKPRVRNFLRYVALRKQLQADYDGMLEAARLREDVEHITRHDLKGPLAGVIGLIQTAAADETLDRAELKSRLRLAEETALQVLDMINLSSELFKIESGRFTLDAKPVVIGDILHRIAEISQASFASKELTVAVEAALPDREPMPQVLCDAMLCFSLFQNLIKNACEAAPEGSRVSVTLSGPDPVRIVVRNEGVVPAEIRERFFDKFVTRGKEGGTGLGTYSAKLLAEAQGGQIMLDVADETGTTSLVVDLPRAPAS
jgi:DNA-binding response OmpR family regulator